jgi:uncharacterized LabA/DUF88 family protein
MDLLSIGIFIDGGYLAKINEALADTKKLNINIASMFKFVTEKISSANNCPVEDCQITESHYFRGRFRANDASTKSLLYSERKFEDSLIENDVIFHYKHLREIVNDQGHKEIIEKGIDVWYALEAYELALQRDFDYVVLITGDADHEILAKKLKALKIKVILLTWNLGKHSSTAPQLKDEVYKHIEISKEIEQDGELINRLCRAAKVTEK